MSGKDARIVVWFSAGAASAVASKLILAERTSNVKIVYTDPGSEHPDNLRFLRDCETWLDHEIEIVKSGNFANVNEVFRKRRYINGPAGAPCTVEMKKKLRFAYQQPEDIQVFGYTSEEKDRADRFRENNFEVNLRTPLIEQGLTHSDCLGILERSDIEIPVMYKLGYTHNNCVGCVKGGMGYWNKIRVDFPDVFEEMSKIEREIGASCIKETFLDELAPGRGNYSAEPSIECGLLCAMTADDLNKK